MCFGELHAVFKESPVEADDELLRPQRGGVVESGGSALNRSCCIRSLLHHETGILASFQLYYRSGFRQQQQQQTKKVGTLASRSQVLLFAVRNFWVARCRTISIWRNIFEVQEPTRRRLYVATKVKFFDQAPDSCSVGLFVFYVV